MCPTGELCAPCPANFTSKVLGECRDLVCSGEAADMRDVVADVIDLPLLHQRLPFVRIVPQLPDRQRRGALLAHDPIVAGLFRREQVLAVEEPEPLEVLGELHGADRIGSDRIGSRMECTSTPSPISAGICLRNALKASRRILRISLVAVEYRRAVVEARLTV
jgi:hypothetical protein